MRHPGRLPAFAALNLGYHSALLGYFSGAHNGTGLLAALNRKGAITPLVSYVDQVKRRLRLTQAPAEPVHSL